MTVKEEWSIAGNSIRNYGYEISSVDDWDGFSGRHGANLRLASMHGDYHISRKPYRSKRFRLPVLIRPYNPTTGAVDHSEGGHGHIRENLDNLLGWLDSEDGLISVTRTVPKVGGGTEVREAICEPLEPMAVQDSLGIMRAVILDFNIPSGFWRAQTQRTSLGFSGGNITVNGTAPVNDMVIRILTGTSPVFTHTASGRTLTIAGAVPASGVDIDVGTRLVTKVSDGSAYDNFFTPSDDYWMEWRPGTVALTLSSGTANLYWYDKYQ